MKNTPQTGRFSDLGIASNLLDVLSKKGFETPTPIQHQVIPGALEGKDVIGIAQTGTGKTLAFGIPMIQQILETKGQGLIIVPTRELALQVEEAFRQIGGPLRIKTAVLIGGVPKHRQIRSLKQNPQVVIATPGRLSDLLSDGSFNLKRISVITLDEADRMLDVGFLPEITKILKAAPKDKQTMLFSATMAKQISKLASKFMQLPLRIEIAPQGTSAKNVEQEIFVIRKNDKMRLLDAILDQYKEDTIIIFSRTKHGAKRMTRDIRNMGHTATEIHGNRSQPQRKHSLDGFRKGKYRIMVATDIAARGIDVKEISLVINFDLPECLEDYVHRIGRTGRAGRYGKAISFVTSAQKSKVRNIERLIRKSLPVLDLPELPDARERPKFQERQGNSFKRQKHRRGKKKRYVSGSEQKFQRKKRQGNSKSNSYKRKNSSRNSR